MIPAITVAQMKKVDDLMIHRFNISLEQMMENAGLRLAELSRKILKNASGKNIAVFCGPGNNGGGGMVAARHLHNYGANVSVVLANKKIKRIPQRQLNILKKLDLSIINYSQYKISALLRKSELVIDALLGYNLKGNPRGKIKDLVEMINESGKKVLSLDVPTGLDATTGRSYVPCIKAFATLTLALPKSGLNKVKNLYLANISVPDELYKRLKIKVSKNIFRAKDIIKL